MKNKVVSCVIAMAIVVILSNILVQFMFGNWLTYGAFTYPLAFLINDLTNKFYGPAAARKVILYGFGLGVICSLIGTQISTEFGPLVTYRIALGSGIAFLFAQITDLLIFNYLRRYNWWRAPLASSIIGSSLDTALFFFIAFSITLNFLEPSNNTSWANEIVPLLGIGLELPLWISLGFADFIVKMSLALLSLIPFRIILINWYTQ